MAFLGTFREVKAVVNISHSGDTITITGSGACNFSDVNTAISDSTIISISSKVVTLNASINISSSNIHFFINSTDCTELDFVSYPTLERVFKWAGQLSVKDCSIYGFESGAYDVTPANRSKFYSVTARTTEFNNVTMAYLGNGTITTALDHINASSHSSIQVRILVTGQIVNFTDITFHNCSVVYVYTERNTYFTDCTFTDPYMNNTLFIKYPRYVTLENCIFNNASDLLIHDSRYLENLVRVENCTFQNSWHNDSNIIDTSRSWFVYVDNCTINNCGSESILYIGWESRYVYFRNLYFNNTGTVFPSGIWGRDGARYITFQDCLLENTMGINFRDNDHCTFENVTVIGNNLGLYQTGLQPGNHSTVTDCHVYNCSFAGMIVLGDTEVYDNVIDECETGILVYPGNIYTYRPVSNVDVYNNTITNCSLAGDHFNVGLRIYGSPNGTVNDVYAYNNVIEGGNIGILVAQGAKDIVIENNSISCVAWGMGQVHSPVGYPAVDNDPYLNNSDRRVNIGVACMRSYFVGWIWDNVKDYRFTNITIGDNTFNSTYLQSYVWLDYHLISGVNYLAEPINVTGFDNDYYITEWYDSFYNGSKAWLVEDNPIYRIDKRSHYSMNTTYFVEGINSTYLGFRVPVANNTNIVFKRQYVTSGQVFEWNHIQPNDNNTRLFSLYLEGNYTKNYCNFTERSGSLTLKFKTLSSNSSVIGNWTVSYYRYPNRVTFNNVQNGSLWSFDSSTALTILFWNYTDGSPIEIILSYTVVMQPYLPYMFILGMIGLGSMFGGSIYTIQLLKQKEYRWAMVQGVTFISIGFGLFIAWVFA